MIKSKKRIFNILFIAVFAAMLGLGIVSPLMPSFAENLGANGIWLGIIFSGFALSRGIFMPIIGTISDKKGRKKFITFGLFLYSVISLLYLSANNVYILTLIRLVHGFASAMVIPIAMAYVGETIEEGKEGSSMGTFNISLFLGMGTGPFLGGFIHDSFGFAWVFYSMAILSAFAFFITVIYLPDIKFDNPRTESISFKRLLQNNTIKGLLLFRITKAIGLGSVLSFLPIFAADLHISLSQIGTLLSVNILLSALLQKSFGKLADTYNKLHLILTGSLIGTLPLVVIPFAHNFIDLLYLNIIMGIGGAIAMPAASAITVKIGKKVGMGTAMGLFNTAMSAGMVVSPLLAGVIMESLGINFVFYNAGLISLIGTFLFYYYARKGKKEI